MIYFKYGSLISLVWMFTNVEFSVTKLKKSAWQETGKSEQQHNVH